MAGARYEIRIGDTVDHLAGWCRRLGIPRRTVENLIARGTPVVEAINAVAARLGKGDAQPLQGLRRPPEITSTLLSVEGSLRSIREQAAGLLAVFTYLRALEDRAVALERENAELRRAAGRAAA
jgi:hypothetical protein